MFNKILIVDDDPDILEAVQFVLNNNGYDPIIDSGEGIDEKINQYSPDLIILDILLSGQDGRDIAKKIRNQKETEHIPIIAFSAHPSAGVSIKKYGINDFIAKPFDIDDLLQKVEKNINLGKNSRGKI